MTGPRPGAPGTSAHRRFEGGCELHTERLALSPFHEQELEELHGLFTDADVRRSLLDDVIVSEEWVADEIESSRERFDETGCGLWAVREREAPAVIGFVGYRPFFEPPELQLLYGFLATHWGRGLATEAADEALRFGFEVLGFEEVKAATDAPNGASMRVLQRVGMTRCAPAAAAGPDTVFFRVSPPAWRTARALRGEGSGG